MPSKLLMILTVLWFGLGMVACGQKGPLYLPDTPESHPQASDQP